GKLLETRRFQWLEPLADLAAGAPTVVSDRYHYEGPAGAMSRKLTRLELPAAGVDASFESGYGYDTLGAVSSLGYPRCLAPCADPAPARILEYGYERGFLTAVPGFADRIAYQGSGTLHQIEHANGVVETHEIDAAHGLERPYQISTDRGFATGVYRYDGAGNIRQIGAQRQRYDALGRPDTLGYPDGMQVGYGYDAFGRLATVDDGGRGRPLARYSYDTLGRLERLERDNGAASRYRFDMAGQLTDIVHTRAGQTLAASHYQLDTLGRRVSQRREDGITERYGHDATGQITAVDYGTPAAGTETFSYDPLGNRTQVGRVVPNAPSVTETYTTNNLNQYTKIDSSLPAPRSSLLTYDLNGNLLFDGTQRLGYDAQNRLVTVEREGLRAEFLYDARNRCVVRRFLNVSGDGSAAVDASASRALTYDTRWNLLAERTLDGALAGRYIHGARTDEILRADLSASELPSANSQLRAIYPLADGLGSTVALTNTRAESPTATAIPPTAGDSAHLGLSPPSFGLWLCSYRFLFTGREWLAAVWLNEHRYRYYSPGIARWVTTDPIGFDGGDLNVVRYVRNSVVAASDPSGLAIETKGLWFWPAGWLQITANLTCDSIEILDSNFTGYGIVIFAGWEWRSFAVKTNSNWTGASGRRQVLNLDKWGERVRSGSRWHDRCGWNMWAGVTT
ncbi:MAG: RHS repeat-associated core domain-containing protein, partial [Thermoanaerobaculia bacterium]|nr:RHS repeat-associated core domain-containing protein [Thermoanaerobaculia bacterium]